MAVSSPGKPGLPTRILIPVTGSPSVLGGITVTTAPAGSRIVTVTSDPSP